MWKESLRIGIDVIDEQHKALFDKIEELLNELKDNSANHKQNCIDAITFLKNYAVKHFADEEAYQQSIGYKDFEAHKKLHEGFVKTVLEHEQKMIASDFADTDVKAFTGMLIAWLLYHVGNSDQSIGKATPVKQTEQQHTHHDIVYSGICDVLSKMAGYDTQVMKSLKTPGTIPAPGDINVIEVTLTGGATGYINMIYPLTFTKNLMEAMMGFEPETIGELEISALFEVSNIISGTVCRQIESSKNIVCDISTPYTIDLPESDPDEKIVVDTGRGILEADVSIAYT